MVFLRVFIFSIIISLSILSMFYDLKLKSNDRVLTEKTYSYRNLSNRLVSGKNQNLTSTPRITEFQINHGSYGTLDWILNFINLTLRYKKIALLVPDRFFLSRIRASNLDVRGIFKAFKAFGLSQLKTLI